MSNASNIKASRCVYKWKFAKDEKGEMERAIRLRLVLRMFMDREAFDVETFSGSARRSSQRLLATAAARNKQWIIAPLDINMAFPKGLTEATGEEERGACFTLPPGSASVLRSLRGSERHDESKHCLQRLEPGTGTEDAPRAFSLQLRKTTRGFWSQTHVLRRGLRDEEFETSSNLLTAKHVEDINLA
eukprot:3007478-Pyramimonas_sp.AAC.1